jgi:hypothetical protein
VEEEEYEVSPPPMKRTRGSSSSQPPSSFLAHAPIGDPPFYDIEEEFTEQMSPPPASKIPPQSFSPPHRHSSPPPSILPSSQDALTQNLFTSLQIQSSESIKYLREEKDSLQRVNADLLAKIDNLQEKQAQLEKKVLTQKLAIEVLVLEAQKKEESEKMGCSSSEEATAKVLDQKKLFHQGFFYSLHSFLFLW